MKSISLLLILLASICSAQNLVPFYVSGTAQVSAPQFDTADGSYSGGATSLATTTTFAGSNITAIFFAFNLNNAVCCSVKSDVDGHWTVVDSLKGASSTKHYMWKKVGASAGVHIITSYWTSSQVMQQHVISFNNAGDITGTQRDTAQVGDSMGFSLTAQTDEVMVDWFQMRDSMSVADDYTYGSGQTERRHAGPTGSYDIEGTLSTKTGTGSPFIMYRKRGAAVYNTVKSYFATIVQSAP